MPSARAHCRAIRTSVLVKRWPPEEDRTAILWDVHTGEAGHRMHGEFGPVYFVSLSATGARLASGTFDGALSV